MAESLTQSNRSSEGSNPAVQKIMLDWVSAADGSVNQALDGVYTGKIVGLWTDPGAAAPTDNYDIELQDEDGDDVLLAAGHDRDTAVDEGVGSDSLGACVDDTLTLVIANAGDTKAGRIVVWIMG